MVMRDPLRSSLALVPWLTAFQLRELISAGSG